MEIHGDQTSWEWKEKSSGVSDFLSLWFHGPSSLLLSAIAVVSYQLPQLRLNFSLHVALLRTILVHTSLI